MDSGGAIQEIAHHRKNPKENLDRFIPNRSAMDWDYAITMLTGGWKSKENPAMSSPSKEAYQKRLRDVFNLNSSRRILVFKNKPTAPIEFMPKEYYPIKPQRFIYKKPKRELDAPGLINGYHLNLLDWGSRNSLAVALGSTVYIWDAANGITSELCTIDDDVTSVNWAPNGHQIAVGLKNSEVQLWDSTTNQQLRTLRGGHKARVGSLAWNNNILSTGAMDKKIINNDVRIKDHIVETYRGHQREVFGLKWSDSGQQLASGGRDKLLHIWYRRLGTSSHSASQWLHRLKDHTGAVRALAWCPFQGHLLASGGGGVDRCIKFWNTHTGACLNS